MVFRIKVDSRDALIAEWLYLYFNRSEFDRYVITNSWGQFHGILQLGGFVRHRH